MDLDQTFASAASLQAEGKSAEAAALLERLADEQPEALEVHLALGAGYFANGRLAEAAEAFRTAVWLAPRSETASLGLFRSLWKKGEAEAAHGELRRFLKGADSAVHRALLQKLECADDHPAAKAVAKTTRWVAAALLSVVPCWSLSIVLSPQYAGDQLFHALPVGLLAAATAYAWTGNPAYAGCAVLGGAPLVLFHVWFVSVVAFSGYVHPLQALGLGALFAGVEAAGVSLIACQFFAPSRVRNVLSPPSE